MSIGRVYGELYTTHVPASRRGEAGWELRKAERCKSCCGVNQLSNWNLQRPAYSSRNDLRPIALSMMIVMGFRAEKPNLVL